MKTNIKNLFSKDKFNGIPNSSFIRKGSQGLINKWKVYDLICRELSHLPVLSYFELRSDMIIQPITRIFLK